jgi:hypothetical protein
VDYTVNVIERNGEYFLQEVFAVTEFQYVEQVTAGPFKARWEADVKRSWLYPAYRGLTDELCRLQHWSVKAGPEVQTLRQLLPPAEIGTAQLHHNAT